VPADPAAPAVFRRRAAWALLIGVLVALAVTTLWSRRWGAPGTAAPPVLGTIPDFTFTERDGSRVSRADLAGEPWIAAFIFTRCGSICPRITDQMIRLGTLMPHPELVRRVSFTVDPEYDTPQVLSAYARDHGIAPAATSRWLFLNGPESALKSLVRNGFKLVVEKGDSPEDPILHSSRLVLVDGQGSVRGYYDAFDEEAIGRLLEDLRALLRES